ncbi:Separin [Trichinella pseudospiralis]
MQIRHLKVIVTSTVADREELLTKRYRKHCSHFELKIQSLNEQLSEDKEEVCMQQQHAFNESLQKEMKQQLDLRNSKNNELI